eukprot:TRINITY_DN6864_c0_g1_i2.p1 TRINITY_DN6864_c0_g1~~TRINITY_DN6864_c0_g1_i2.p1  ORF type:complete len:609 (-),score=205.83 TRINITY_DN6864_c0_g1_i2:981-2807(-)
MTHPPKFKNSAADRDRELDEATLSSLLPSSLFGPISLHDASPTSLKILRKTDPGSPMSPLSNPYLAASPRRKEHWNRFQHSTRAQNNNNSAQQVGNAPNGGAAGPNDRGWYELDMSGIGLRALGLEIRNYAHITALYLSNNRLTALVDDIFADMKALTTLDLGFNLLTRLPTTVTQLNLLEKLYLQENRIVELPIEMGRLYRLKELLLDGNPLVSPPQTITQHGTNFTIAYLRDRMPMPPPPPERRFISYISDGKDAPFITEKEKLRVLTYNILAEQYATQEQYFYCPSWALDWNYRKQGLLKEILAYDCDVICLQEVEVAQYTEFFQVELAKHGYAGVIAAKSRARTMEDWGSVDGCATFYKRNKFHSVEEHIIEYQSVAMSKHKEFSEEAFSRAMTKDNVAVILILQLKDDNSNATPNNKKNQKARHLLVANTHIHWNPDNKDVKLIQVQMLLEHIASVASPKSKWPRVPMILCGDFNSSVDSGPYELLTTGNIKPRHSDLEPFDYGTYSTNGMRHPYSLSSAYALIGEPTFTNCTSEFVGVLDYLFFSQDSLGVSKVLQPVDEETVRLTRLPNAYMNSDHISLVSEFYFKKSIPSNNNSGPTKFH